MMALPLGFPSLGGLRDDYHLSNHVPLWSFLACGVDGSSSKIEGKTGFWSWRKVLKGNPSAFWMFGSSYQCFSRWFLLPPSHVQEIYFSSWWNFYSFCVGFLFGRIITGWFSCAFLKWSPFSFLGCQQASGFSCLQSSLFHWPSLLMHRSYLEQWICTLVTFKNDSERRNRKGNGPGYSPKKNRKEAVLPPKKRAKFLLRLFRTRLQSNSNHNCLLQWFCLISFLFSYLLHSLATTSFFWSTQCSPMGSVILVKTVLDQINSSSNLWQFSSSEGANSVVHPSEFPDGKLSNFKGVLQRPDFTSLVLGCQQICRLALTIFGQVTRPLFVRNKFVVRNVTTMDTRPVGV